MNQLDILGALKGAYGTVSHPFKQANEYGRTYDRLRASGIAGPSNFGAQTPPQSSDAAVLAHLLTYGGYDTNPLAQDRYVSLLKQLGYLRNQAY